MSQRALRLPIRALPNVRNTAQQWVCRRCLATSQAEPTPSSATPVPPPQIPRKKDPSEAENYDPTLPASQRDYRLTKTDVYLKQPLPHAIPPQYLMHSTSEILHESEKAQREKFTGGHKRIVGVVVSAGKMNKTVKVRVAGKTWNKRVKKHFASHKDHLVHDPNSSLVVGDVVSLHRLRVTPQVQHVVAAIVSPYGTPIDQRPPVPTADERFAAYKEYRFAKLHRRSLRRRAAEGDAEAIAELKRMGLDPGKGVQASKGQTANLQNGVGKSLGRKGKHDVGKLNDQALRNKEKTMKLEERAEENLLESKEKDEELERQALAADSKLKQITQDRGQYDQAG